MWSFSAIHPHSKRRLSLFTLELTQQCNFRCSYCCFSGKYHDRRVHNARQMTLETMEQTLRFIVDSHCKDRLTIVTFYGGEALLALDKIKWMISHLRLALGSNVGFSISTNGYALSKDVVDWLCTVDDCEVYITIDGYRELHNSNRRTAGGQPTFDRIMSNLRYFRDKYPVEYNKRVHFLVTLQRWRQLPEVSDKWMNNSFLRDKIPVHMSFILPKNIQEMRNSVSPMKERLEVLELALERYQKGEDSLLTRQFKEWTDGPLRNMSHWQNGTEITVATCLEDMYRTFISAEGDVYVCERFCSNFTIGHVSYKQVLDERKIDELEQHFIDRRNRLCTHCTAAKSCTMCMTSLNYSDEELSALCVTEREMCAAIKEYSWRRRMYDRKKELSNINNFVK